MSAFQWTEKATNAALALADGRTQEEVADIAGVTDRTIRRWLALPEFGEEVDRLTLITGIARKAERLKIAKRMTRRLENFTEKDLLDWLKYAQSETEGIRLGLAPELAALLKNAGLLAEGGSGRTIDAEQGGGDK
jgi:transposase